MSKKQAKQEIPAVVYARKSTAEAGHEKSIADQLTRIKRLVPSVAGAEYKIVRIYEKDKGVPGWKRGAKRPDYFKLVGELKETGAKAILVDDMDRFSRSDPMETVSDVQHLRELGVRYIHAVNQGCKDLVEGGAIVPMQIAMEANASHEFSTRLSRRIAEARLKAAAEGKRSGGNAPYGMENDGQGGLVRGDRKEIKIVQQIFTWFTRDYKALNWIADELNERKVPSSQGKLWYPATVTEILQRRAYRGDFTYNSKKSGQFHIVNGKRQVVPVYRYQDQERQPWKRTADGEIILLNRYSKPVIDPDVWDAAKNRLVAFSLKGSRQRKELIYPLAGILICDHCGKYMYGCEPKGRHRAYRCSARAKQACPLGGKPELHEEDILPNFLRLLEEKINKEAGRADAARKTLLNAPPEHLRNPKKHRADERTEKQLELAERIERLDRAANDWLKAPETIQPILRQKMVAEQEAIGRLKAELEMDKQNKADSPEDSERLRWLWDYLTKRVLRVKVGEYEQDDDFDAKCKIWRSIDPVLTREFLLSLGAEIRLRWKRRTVTLPGGKKQPRYELLGGEFSLGNWTGKVKGGKNGVTLDIAPPAAPCSGIRGAGRCGSRRGTG